ncbi:cytidine deaminase [Anaerosporobacter faecicola]|uniref:cytidine deaminase n=1 Tax=Anaerosporobacter faecicola TaxID=2718714 RepID=UPI00143BC655|nr:cytidine deaminase [Anaerosporobacter faecicola]
MDNKELIRKAIDGLKYSYAPYSNFNVSAVLVTKDGEIYTGCNIENAGYTPTNCAERTAFFKAISEGVRGFEKIVIVAGKNRKVEGMTAPCGVCRQVMMEFCDPKTFKIILAESEDTYKEFTLEELLPLGFGPGDLLEG